MLHYRFEEVSKRLTFWISKDVQVSEQDKQSLTRKRPKFHVSLNWLLKQSSRLFVEIIRGLKWRRITGDILTDLQVCSKSGDFIRVRSFGWAVIARLLDCPPLNDRQNRLFKSRASWKINPKKRKEQRTQWTNYSYVTYLSLFLSRFKIKNKRGERKKYRKAKERKGRKTQNEENYRKQWGRRRRREKMRDETERKERGRERSARVRVIRVHPVC